MGLWALSPAWLQCLCTHQEPLTTPFLIFEVHSYVYNFQKSLAKGTQMADFSNCIIMQNL